MNGRPDKSLPAEILVEPLLPDGNRYVLPQRHLGTWRWFALPFILFGLGFSAFAVFWVVGASGIRDGQPGAVQLAFAAFGIPFILRWLCTNRHRTGDSVWQGRN